MKKLIYIFLGATLSLVMSSCKDWLDVNTDPDSPNNASATVDTRLPWIENYFTRAMGVSNFRTSCIAGNWYGISSTNNFLSTTWAFGSGATTTPYQLWFVTVGTNLQDLYDKAKDEGAYHYMAASELYHAMGFMDMLDIYGEMPYTEALTSNAVPPHDDGKTIYYGCLEKIDNAIELFGKDQETGATALSAGDPMYAGDADKWIKLCYSLKARYLNRISKKSDLYDPDLILECLEKGIQSNDDNAYLPAYNSESDEEAWTTGDPVMTNGNWNYCAYGSYQRVSQYYIDQLTNMRDSGVEDPRYTKIVPAAMVNIKLDANGAVSSYEWMRSKGVDVRNDESGRLYLGGAASIQTNIYFASSDVTVTYSISDEDAAEEFVAGWEGTNKTVVDSVSSSGHVVSVTYPAGSVYSSSTSYYAAGDTAYVNMRSNSMLTSGVSEMNMNFYYGANSSAAKSAGAVASTGSFQVRPISNFEMFMYHEACFIKAEVYLRQGNTSAALSAYQAGIQAHLDYMQSVLEDWDAAGYTDYNPDMGPMDSSAITAYMSSDAVCQSAASLTMSDIMLQKWVAMGCSIENWVDMRRFNYSAGNVEDFGVVYPDFDRSAVFSGNTQLSGTSKTDPKYWPRRWQLPATYELSYNETNALAVNPNCKNDDIWCYPVWWDCETDSEYYGYLGRSE